MFLSEWREFPLAPWFAGKKTWWQLASRCCWNRASMTCFRACCLPSRAKDFSAVRYLLKRPTTNSYPEPYDSSPHEVIFLFKVHFNIIFRLIQFLQTFLRKIFPHLFCPMRTKCSASSKAKLRTSVDQSGWITYLLTYSMVQSPSWEANWFAASQEIPRIFMEPEGSLPHSQASATCPYPGPAQSSPHTHIPPPGNPS